MRTRIPLSSPALYPSPPWPRVGIVLIAALGLLAWAVYLIPAGESDPRVAVSTQNVLDGLLLASGLAILGCFIVACIFFVDKGPGLFLLAFGIRIALAILLSFVLQYDDERGIHRIAENPEYYNRWGEGGQVYYVALHHLYSVLGYNLLLPKVINAWLGSILPFLVHDLAQNLFGEKRVANRALLLAAFIPPLVISSSVNLKEIGTAFLLVLGFWFLLVSRFSLVIRTLGVAFTVAVLYMLRMSAWTAPLVGGIGLYVLLRTEKAQAQRPGVVMLERLFLSLVLLLVLSVVFVPALSRDARTRFSDEGNMKRFAVRGAAVTQVLDASDPMSGRNIGILFVRGLYAPSPLRALVIPHLSTEVEAVNMVVWYWLFPCAVAGSLASWKNGGAGIGMTTLILLTAAIVGLAAGTDLYRHRMSLYGLMVALGAGGVEVITSPKYRWIVWVWGVGGIGFTGMWLLLQG